MATWVWILLAVVAVLVVLAVVVAAMRKRRSAALRDRFGPEYERTMRERDGRRTAEAELRNRQKERERFTITPLPEPARLRYAEQWRGLQERFVDQPSSAVMEADELVRQVMGAEGYPMDDFSAQADLVSVEHPRVVENYRIAHDVYERTQVQQASTEDMRTALLSYRSLFDELLATDGDAAAEQRAPEPGRQPSEAAGGGRWQNDPNDSPFFGNQPGSQPGDRR